MKYSKWHLKVVICCFFVLLGVHGYTGATEESPWSFIGFTKYRDALFIDKTRLSRPSTGKVLVTARIEPSAKSLFRGNIKQEVPQYRKSLKNFKYLVLEMELSCRSHQLRVLKIQFFSATGKVMHTAADPEAPGKPVKSGSLWKDLEGAVCP
ncbi:MAG: hypothetical protein M0P16_08795 [Syntrophales bacterium]|nr:hypothetical protein [Syntrophales bacterium]